MRVWQRRMNGIYLSGISTAHTHTHTAVETCQVPLLPWKLLIIFIVILFFCISEIQIGFTVFHRDRYRWRGAFCARPPSTSPIGAVNLWYNSHKQCRLRPSTQSLSLIFQPTGRAILPFHPWFL